MKHLAKDGRPSAIIFRICFFSLLLITTIVGCALKLFEYPVVSEPTAATGKLAADSPKMEMVNMLKQRGGYKLEAEKDGTEQRLIRKDLQDFIDSRWLEGDKYIKSLPLNIHASDSYLSDGLMSSPSQLARFYPGIKIKPDSKTKPGVKLSFIHLSDVQLRDERVYMFDRELTHLLDYFADGFEHEPEMVFYDYAYYLTHVSIIKRLKDLLPENRQPAFMIHTGDGLHMGVVSELYEFLYITNKLKIPWFNVLGNHDYQVYGNLHSKDVGVINPNMGFQTINSRYNFINMHGKGFKIDKKVYFSPDNAPDSETRRMKRSIYNGFDLSGSGFLHAGRVRERRNMPCVNCPGYYHFEATSPSNGEPGILAVVLDTTTRDFRFAKGTVYRHNETDDDPGESAKYQQINWLRDVLEEYAGKGNWMVLAFGHHALQRESFFDDSYNEVIKLFANPKYNVAAYFCGHSHDYKIQYKENAEYPGRFGFWEIITASIMEYPKRGSLVNVYVTDEGYWEISLQSINPYFFGSLPADTPTMLKDAKKCFAAAEKDREGKKKKKKFSKLDRKHYDVMLKFPYPK